VIECIAGQHTFPLNEVIYIYEYTNVGIRLL
jgi:hypothetical protein